MSLVAHEIRLRRGAAEMLAGISAELRQGELLGVLGPNGAGKTTLLRVWAGLIAPDRGAVMLDDTRLELLVPASRARSIAYLPQDGAAAWNLTVAETVSLGRLPHGGGDNGAVARALEAVGAWDWRARKIATLSGGEMQRVLLARALAVEAKYLLADEPVASLDPRYQLAVLDLLAAQADAGKGVAIVMHDLNLALRYCDRVILLDRGRIAGEGAPANVLDAARLAAVYGIEAVRGRENGQNFILPLRVEGQK